MEKWPEVPYGTRVMVVKDPVPRNAFVPRSLPATVFGPSERVPGGMVVYQDGRLKEVVSLQVSELNAEELVFVKGRMDDWGTPIAPCVPPASDDWDATRVSPNAADSSRMPFDGQQLLPDYVDDEPPAEAPQVEELPECPKIRVEEIIYGQPADVLDAMCGPSAFGRHGAAVASPTSQKMSRNHKCMAPLT